MHGKKPAKDCAIEMVGGVCVLSQLGIDGVFIGEISGKSAMRSWLSCIVPRDCVHVDRSCLTAQGGDMLLCERQMPAPAERRASTLSKTTKMLGYRDLCYEEEKLSKCRLRRPLADARETMGQ